MKVYFCASLAGGREQNQDIVVSLVDFIEQRGHNVLDNHVAAEDPQAKHAENLGISREELTPEIILSHDIECIEKAHCLIAELSAKGSYGVGGEIHHCWMRPLLGLEPIPMLFLYQTDKVPRSAFVFGRQAHSVWIREYINLEDAKRIVLEFFREFSLESK